MTAKIEVEFCSDLNSAGRSVPAACATCRLCDQVATAAREQTTYPDGTVAQAAGLESLPRLGNRAVVALLQHCPHGPFAHDVTLASGGAAGRTSLPALV